MYLQLIALIPELCSTYLSFILMHLSSCSIIILYLKLFVTFRKKGVHTALLVFNNALLFPWKIKDLGHSTFLMLWIWFILAMGGEWQLLATQTFPVIHGVPFVSALKEALHMLPSRKEKEHDHSYQIGYGNWVGEKGKGREKCWLFRRKLQECQDCVCNIRSST